MTIVNKSASAQLSRRRRLSAVDGLLSAVDDKEARDLHQVVADNLGKLWETGGRRNETRRGLRPKAILIRNGFVAAAATDVHGPVLARLVQSKGLQLRLYLLMLFDAQCRHNPGARVHNVRTVSPSSGGLYASWRQLVLSAGTRPHECAGPYPPVTARRLRERQIKEAMVALEERHRLLQIGVTAAGRQRRDFDHITVLSEISTRDEQARYSITEEDCFSVPTEFFTGLWIFALTDAELACYLALRWAAAQARPRSNRDFFITSRRRVAELRLTRSTWNCIEPLRAYGLITRTDDEGRDPRNGRIASFRDRWQAGEVSSPRYTFTREGVHRPALPTMRAALLDRRYLNARI